MEWLVRSLTPNSSNSPLYREGEEDLTLIPQMPPIPQKPSTTTGLTSRRVLVVDGSSQID